MTFEYMSVEEAIKRGGLRMVVVGDVPSLWGEAAKGIFHIKRLDWVAVRLDYDSEALAKWAGRQDGPVAIYEDEPPRAGWAEILLLAERLAPTPSLIPKDSAERALMFGLAHEICGEAGLGWERRLQLVHAGLRNEGGFPERIAQFIGSKYGYTREAGAASGQRVAELLRMLTSRLKAQQQTGSPYYVGETVTAVDIYSATCTAMFAPLPTEQCEMHPKSRAAFNMLDEQTTSALDPILIEHRDMIYTEFLELPLAL